MLTAILCIRKMKPKLPSCILDLMASLQSLRFEKWELHETRVAWFNYKFYRETDENVSDNKSICKLESSMSGRKTNCHIFMVGKSLKWQLSSSAKKNSVPRVQLATRGFTGHLRHVFADVLQWPEVTAEAQLTATLKKNNTEYWALFIYSFLKMFLMFLFGLLEVQVILVLFGGVMVSFQHSTSGMASSFLRVFQSWDQVHQFAAVDPPMWNIQEAGGTIEEKCWKILKSWVIFFCAVHMTWLLPVTRCL